MSLDRYPIMKYSREQIARLVNDGVIPPERLRDYDIIYDRESGERRKEISNKHNIAPETVSRIIKKNKKM